MDKEDKLQGDGFFLSRREKLLHVIEVITVLLKAAKVIRGLNVKSDLIKF